MHVRHRLAAALALALLLLGAASAQSFAPERILRLLASDADIALLRCPAGAKAGAPDGQVRLCGRYEYGAAGFRLDVERAAADLLAFGAWSHEDGTLTRTFLVEDAVGRGLFHVGFRNGAVMLTFYPRGG